MQTATYQPASQTPSSQPPTQWHARNWTCHAPTTVGVSSADGRQFTAVAECSGHGGTAEQAIEYARLVAAAPELLDAVRSLLKAHCASKGYWAPGAEMARAIIAKATGGAA